MFNSRNVLWQGSVWQTQAPKLLGFWAQNLPAHPEWKISPDRELVGTVRQILLKQIGQRNAESGLYQEMLGRIARNWPDLTLSDMTGDTDASASCIGRSNSLPLWVRCCRAWSLSI